MFRALCVLALRKAADYLEGRSSEEPLEIGVPVSGVTQTLTDEARELLAGEERVTLIPPRPEEPLAGSVEARVASLRRF